MTDRADITIIGAGVVGLAIATEVAREGRQVYILEKDDTFGKHQSSRSAEVIHAGIYNAPGSLKTQLCLEGNRRLYELCQENAIVHTRCGKIIMATNPPEEAQLAKLFQQGQANGVPVQMLSQAELHRIEPNLVAKSSFFSPNSGTVDSYGLMKFFLGKAQDKGANLACRAEVIAIKKIPDGYEVRVKGNPDYTFVTHLLINSAGLHSARIAELAGIDTRTANYQVRMTKGEFYSVAGHKDRQINHLIYPVPMQGGPGIHVCFDAEHRLRLGPLFTPVEEVDYGMNDSRRTEFVNSPMALALPIIEASDLEPESTGIMVQLTNPGDFIIRHEHERALPGLINLVGIGSPGLTSSPAIAKYAATMVNDILAS